jgi:hypothetical protein
MTLSVSFRRVISYIEINCLTVIGLVKALSFEMDCWRCKELYHLLVAMNWISGFKPKWDEVLMDY